jgi:hypothetical protein
LNALCAVALAVAAAVVVEIVLPGQNVYHTGWYNVLLLALVIVAIVAGRRGFRRTSSVRAQAAIAMVMCGTAVVGLAGIASGLLAPDNQTLVGAPGQRLHVESLGTLVFPIAGSTLPAQLLVVLERPLHAPSEIGEGPRIAGGFILRTQPRSVVYVEARDARGNRLTVTQPEGSAFLSPVLLMEHRQSIAGLDLPFDSFNVPAARRIVKAVMFTSAQAAMLLRGGARLGEPAVLFAVDDENERPLPHAIGLSSGGHRVGVDGLVLRGVVTTYPAVSVVAAPNVLATAFGTLLVLGGVIGLIWSY